MRPENCGLQTEPGVLLRLPRGLLSDWQLLLNILTKTSRHCLSFRGIKRSFIYFVSCSLRYSFLPWLMAPRWGSIDYLCACVCEFRARGWRRGVEYCSYTSDCCMIHSSPAGDRCSSQKHCLYCENQLIKYGLQKFFFFFSRLGRKKRTGLANKIDPALWSWTLRGCVWSTLAAERVFLSFLRRFSERLFFFGVNIFRLVGPAAVMAGKQVLN